MTYQDFLETKRIKYKESGFEIDESELNPNLYDFQKHIVKRCLKFGRYAIFADTGLGKTIMQGAWADEVVKKTNKPVLILAPLAVSLQAIKELKKFEIEVEKLDTNQDIYESKIYITNYEQLGNVDLERMDIFGVVLDESSILKNYTGKYKNLIISKFKRIQYKLACTATPSPNDINEIGNHSEFLNILDAPDMRSRWFVRNEGMNNYRLKSHGKKEFYEWISSWSFIITSPADIGFHEEAKLFKLPNLKYEQIEIKGEKKDNDYLIDPGVVNATNFNAELRRTIKERLSEAKRIVDENPDESFIIWVAQNREEDELKKLLHGYDFRVVTGSDKPETKEKNLLDFADGKFKILVTKSKIAGMGMNFQNCHRQIFISLDFSFEKLYQSIRRSYRFGQKKDVTIYLMKVETMGNVVDSIQKKQEQFEELRNSVKEVATAKEYKLVMDYEKQEKKTDNYHLINGDSVIEIDGFEDNSFDFSIFSPPFSNLFTYSDSYRDMGNSANHEEFFEQTDFLLKKLYAKMRPCRIVAVHTKDLAVYKGSSGYTGLYDFTGDYHRAMEKAGFKYHSKVSIWTDPVLERARTNTQRLLYKQVRGDSTLSGVGLSEYLTIFKKWDDEKNEKPVNNKTYETFPLPVWQEWASGIWGKNFSQEDLEETVKFYFEQNGLIGLDGVMPEWLTGSWFDIKRTDVLKDTKDIGDEKHICPLQLTVIERAIQMWSNPGEIVFTPFCGIGSEPAIARKLKRKAVGIELKKDYWLQSITNIEREESKERQGQLF